MTMTTQAPQGALPTPADIESLLIGTQEAWNNPILFNKVISHLRQVALQFDAQARQIEELRAGLIAARNTGIEEAAVAAEKVIADRNSRGLILGGTFECIEAIRALKGGNRG